MKEEALELSGDEICEIDWQFKLQARLRHQID
jgi:hypothetical protein